MGGLGEPIGVHGWRLLVLVAGVMGRLGEPIGVHGWRLLVLVAGVIGCMLTLTLLISCNTSGTLLILIL